MRSLTTKREAQDFILQLVGSVEVEKNLYLARYGQPPNALVVSSGFFNLLSEAAELSDLLPYRAAKMAGSTLMGLAIIVLGGASVEDWEVTKIDEGILKEVISKELAGVV